jgi:hypothetical protein
MAKKIHMEIRDDQVPYSHHFANGLASDKHATHDVPYFEEKYDPYAYIEWELTIDNEFKKYDLYENKRLEVLLVFFTKYALTVVDLVKLLNRGKM